MVDLSKERGAGTGGNQVFGQCGSLVLLHLLFRVRGVMGGEEEQLGLGLRHQEMGEKVSPWLGVGGEG